MALTTGVGPHSAIINVGGASFPILKGEVTQHAQRKSSTFNVSLPKNYPGAYAALSSLGENTTTISVTTRGMSANLFTGETDKVRFDMIGGIITLAGRDMAAKLHSNISNEKWVNKKGSDIVQDLAGRLGIPVQIDKSGLLAGKLLQQDYVKLSDSQSFAYIIHKLAEFDGARWWVDGNGTLHYVDVSSPSGIYSLNYNPGPPYVVSDCLTLNIHKNVQAGKGITVNLSSWHPKDKKRYHYGATVPGDGSLTYNYEVPQLKQDQVEQHAKSRANEAARHELTVEASVVGDPSCSASMGLQLSGTGAFDQQYVMDCVVHHIGNRGHVTHITARSAANGRSAS